jgi:hypothetical protein
MKMSTDKGVAREQIPKCLSESQKMYWNQVSGVPQYQIQQNKMWCTSIWD